MQDLLAKLAKKQQKKSDETILILGKSKRAIIGDYCMPFWLSPDQPESFSLRGDNGRGLIKRGINKMPCYNLFISYSNPLFIEFYLKEIIEL